MTEKQIKQVKAQLPEGETLNRMYRSYEGDIRRDQPRQERQRTPVHNPPQRRHERNAHKHVRRWTQ